MLRIFVLLCIYSFNQSVANALVKLPLNSTIKQIPAWQLGQHTQPRPVVYKPPQENQSIGKTYRPSVAGWGNLCEPLIRQYEAIHGIPAKLLTAISVVESGRRVGNSVVAWPWTINANGKPYVFATKHEAISMVQRLQAQGITSIDVGCMQVNLKQHPNAFLNLHEAFDPSTNIAYAAKFLKAKRDNQGTWDGAVAHYHSAKPVHHLPYKSKVLTTWDKMKSGTLSTVAVPATMQTLIQKINHDTQKNELTYHHNLHDAKGERSPGSIIRMAPYRGGNGAISSHPKHSGPKIIQGWGARMGAGAKVIPAAQGHSASLFQVRQSSSSSGKIIYAALNPKRNR